MSVKDHVLWRWSGPTDEMGAAKGGRLEEACQGAQNVQMPAVLDLGLAEGDDGPDDLQRWEEEGGSEG